MAKARAHYPVTIYGLALLCALGLAAVALGIADGGVLVAAGVTAISVSLGRLHVILDSPPSPRRSPATSAPTRAKEPPP
jgi:hypothetical protein